VLDFGGSRSGVRGFVGGLFRLCNSTQGPDWLGGWYDRMTVLMRSRVPTALEYLVTDMGVRGGMSCHGVGVAPELWHRR